MNWAFLSIRGIFYVETLWLLALKRCLSSQNRIKLQKLAFEQVSVHLVKSGGEQHKVDYAKLNPQELVPTFVDTDSDDEVVLSQSLAIIEYLDEKYSHLALLPQNIQDKAIVRSMAMSIACEVHPLNNLKVLQYLVKNSMWMMILNLHGTTIGSMKVFVL